MEVIRIRLRLKRSDPLLGEVFSRLDAAQADDSAHQDILLSVLREFHLLQRASRIQAEPSLSAPARVNATAPHIPTPTVPAITSKPSPAASSQGESFDIASFMNSLEEQLKGKS